MSKIVTMTAQGVEASDEIPYRRLELAVEGTKHAWVHLRPTWFSQNFHTFWRQPIVEAGVIPLPVADIGRAAVAALTSDQFDGHAWELTGPHALTYAQAAAILSEAAGKTIRYEPVDDAAFRAQMIGAGLPELRGYARWLVLICAGRSGGGGDECGAAAHRASATVFGRLRPRAPGAVRVTDQGCARLLELYLLSIGRVQVLPGGRLSGLVAGLVQRTD